MNGLATLLQSIRSSIEQVNVNFEFLKTFVTPLLQIPLLIQRIPETSTLSDRIALSHSMDEVAFIDSNVHDDARQGIAALSDMEERATIMVSMVSELRILFGLNIGFAFFVLYYATFLRTISNVVQQVLRLAWVFLALVFMCFAGSIISDISRNHSCGISVEGMSSCSSTLFFWKALTLQ